MAVSYCGHGTCPGGHGLVPGEGCVVGAVGAVDPGAGMQLSLAAPDAVGAQEGCGVSGDGGV
jgi:hypothetical protein